MQNMHTRATAQPDRHHVASPSLPWTSWIRALFFAGYHPKGLSLQQRWHEIIWPTAPTDLPTVQRLYSMFPVGGPGLGLLLLRFSLVASIIYIRDPVIALAPYTVGVVLFFAISLSLAAGLLTPIMAGLGILWGCVALYHGTILSPWCMAAPTLNAVAILLLGPGAYSVDAVLYGRRVLVTPRRRK